VIRLRRADGRVISEEDEERYVRRELPADSGTAHMQRYEATALVYTCWANTYVAMPLSCRLIPLLEALDRALERGAAHEMHVEAIKARMKALKIYRWVSPCLSSPLLPSLLLRNDAFDPVSLIPLALHFPSVAFH
jgi:hypothetical protein